MADTRQELEERVVATSAEASARLVEYLVSEGSVNVESYRCLQEMNLAGVERYRSAADLAAALNVSMKELSEKHAVLHPLLLQVRDIETHVGELERVVLQLNEYTKRLEHRYRALS